MAAPLYYTAEMVRQLNAAEPRHWPRYEAVHVERERLVWHPEGASEPFTLPLAELFREP